MTKQQFKPEPWKRKENRKDSALVQDVTPLIRVRFLDVFALSRASMKRAKRFYVVLHKSMPIEVIMERMEKGFGDLK